MAGLVPAFLFLWVMAGLVPAINKSIGPVFRPDSHMNQLGDKLEEMGWFQLGRSFDRIVTGNFLLL